MVQVSVRNADVIIRLTKERIAKIAQRFEQVLADEAARIVLRTESGQDVNGSPFVDYTPAYARRKAKKGRQVAHPDLTDTGAMLGSIQTRVEPTTNGYRGTIFFGSAREAAKASGNMKTRRFFGLSEEQVTRIKDRLNRGL